MSIWISEAIGLSSRTLAERLVEMVRDLAAVRPRAAAEPLPDDARRQLNMARAETGLGGAGRMHSARRMF